MDNSVIGLFIVSLGLFIPHPLKNQIHPPECSTLNSALAASTSTLWGFSMTFMHCLAQHGLGFPCHSCV